MFKRAAAAVFFSDTACVQESASLQEDLQNLSSYIPVSISA